MIVRRAIADASTTSTYSSGGVVELAIEAEVAGNGEVIVYGGRAGNSEGAAQCRCAGAYRQSICSRD